MKAYGIPRRLEIQYPDLADISLYGLSAPDRCARAYRGKKSSLRIWKKKERLAAKKGIQRELIQLRVDVDADEFEASNP